MKMMVADMINGTVLPKVEVGTISKRTAGDARQMIAWNDELNLPLVSLFFSITKTDTKGIEEIGTVCAYSNTVAGHFEGIGIGFSNFSEGTLNVYFGTGTQGTVELSNMFYSYSIPIYGTNAYSNRVGHRLVIHPYGSAFFEDATWDFGTIEGTTFGSMRLYTDRPLPTVLQDVEYSNVYLLPEQSGYNPYFTEDKVKHKLDNGKTLTYFKGFNFNADINFEQISGTELSNLMEIKNLKTNLRFFPNLTEKPNLSYDVIWDNDFNYPFTVPTYTGGGYNGNIHFEGITRLGSIGDTI